MMIEGDLTLGYPVVTMTIWMDTENMLSKISQTEKVESHMMSPFRTAGESSDLCQRASSVRSYKPTSGETLHVPVRKCDGRNAEHTFGLNRMMSCMNAPWPDLGKTDPSIGAGRGPRFCDRTSADRAGRVGPLSVLDFTPRKPPQSHRVVRRMALDSPSWQGTVGTAPGVRGTARHTNWGTVSQHLLQPIQ